MTTWWILFVLIISKITKVIVKIKLKRLFLVRIALAKLQIILIRNRNKEHLIIRNQNHLLILKMWKYKKEEISRHKNNRSNKSMIKFWKIKKHFRNNNKLENYILVPIINNFNKQRIEFLVNFRSITVRIINMRKIL